MFLLLSVIYIFPSNYLASQSICWRHFWFADITIDSQMCWRTASNSQPLSRTYPSFAVLLEGRARSDLPLPRPLLVPDYLNVSFLLFYTSFLFSILVFCFLMIKYNVSVLTSFLFNIKVHILSYNIAQYVLLYITYSNLSVDGKFVLCVYYIRYQLEQ